VAAVSHTHECNPRSLRQADGGLHGLLHGGMAESIIPIQVGRRRARLFHACLRPGVDRSVLETPNVMGHSDHPMRIDPTQVGVNQGLGRNPAVLFRNPRLWKIPETRVVSSCAMIIFIRTPSWIGHPRPRPCQR